MVSIIRPSSAVRQSCRWQVFADATALQQEAAQRIVAAANAAIKQRGAFHLVLAGGNTPRNVYALLRAAVTDWRCWHIYFGDERCLPADHIERNSVMAARAWLDHVDIPAAQLHPIPAELGAAAAAGLYIQLIDKIKEFDMTLLGLGEDGHTASLFPLHDPGTRADAPAVLAVHGAPKPPAERVSLSAHRLSLSRQVVFLVAGAAKKAAVRAWRNGEPVPASAITPENGVDILIERHLLA